MHLRVLFGSIALMLSLLLGACAVREPARKLAPPPAPTQAQIEKEMQHLQQSFFQNECMARLRATAPELGPRDKPPGKMLYAVEFPAGESSKDGRSHRLVVTEHERNAYLHISGGAGGWYSVRGPLALWPCMAQAVQ